MNDAIENNAAETTNTTESNNASDHWCVETCKRLCINYSYLLVAPQTS